MDVWSLEFGWRCRTARQAKSKNPYIFYKFFVSKCALESSYLSCFEIRVANLFQLWWDVSQTAVQSINRNHAILSSTRKKEEAKTREEYEYVAPESYLPELMHTN